MIIKIFFYQIWLKIYACMMKKKKILKILKIPKILVKGGLGESPKNITNKTA